MTAPTSFSRWFAVALLAVLPLHGQFVIPGPDIRLNGFVFAVESDAAGNVYLGGTFDDFNGDDSSGMGLLRLTSSGAKHATWDIRLTGGIEDLLVYGNFLYVSGAFANASTLTSGDVNQPYLMRIHLSGPNEGKIDPSWIPHVNGPVQVMETDGTSLYIAGNFSIVNATGRVRMAKILTGGPDPDALDPTWNPAPNNTVDDLEFANSQLYAGGGFTSIGGRPNHYLARLSTSGSGASDVAWTPDIDRPIGELESTASHIYFTGDFTHVQGGSHRSLGRFSTAAGAASFDATWKPDPNGEISAMTISGSSLYMAGVFTTVASTNRRFMAKVGTAGTGALDGSFLPEPNGSVHDMMMVGGNVLCGGRFNTTVGSPSAGYAMMNPTSGAAMAGFAGTITTEGRIHCMQPVTGGMILGGLFDTVNGVARTSIAKVLANGSLDASFDVPLVGFNRVVRDIKLDGTTLYFCGDFLTAGGAPTQHIARVNASTGAVDAGWHTKPLTPLLCLETDASYVYIGSAGLAFLEVSPGNALPVANLARLSKGTVANPDTFWRPLVGDFEGNPANASVNDMLFNGSNLIISGKFGFIVDIDNLGDAHQHISVVALSTSGWGEPVGAWSVDFLNEIGDLATVHQLVLHGGALYVAGDFVDVNGNPWFGVAKLNPASGAWDPGFDVSPIVDVGGIGYPGIVSTIAASGSHLYVGGDFDYVYNQNIDDYDYSPDIVRVNPATGVLDYSWYPYPSDSVSCLGFAGSNLWVYGAFDIIGGFTVEGPAIVAPFSGAYQSWLSTYFTPSQIANSDFTAPFQDLDGDGESNLVESFFSTNPFSAVKSYHVANSGTSGLPLIRRENISGQNYLTIEYTRWKSTANAGAAATPQFSDNLASWPRAGVQIGSATSISTDRERVKFRDSVANSPKTFGRVDIVTQTP